MLKEWKNFDFMVNFLVDRNRETLLTIFCLLIKPSHMK